MDSILIFEIDRIYRIQRVLDTRFPDKTGYMQSALDLQNITVQAHRIFSNRLNDGFLVDIF